MISARAFGAREAAVAFFATGSAAQAKTAGVVAYHGARYRDAVKRRASGRPGPNIITRKYHDSIGFRMLSVGPVAVGVAGTDAPQGRRLQNGFFGTDSAGRVYEQPAFPHWEQDLEATANAIAASLGTIVSIDASDISAVSFS